MLFLPGGNMMKIYARENVDGTALQPRTYPLFLSVITNWMHQKSGLAAVFAAVRRGRVVLFNQPGLNNTNVDHRFVEQQAINARRNYD